MSRITVAEYKQIVAKLGAEVEALRVEVSQLRADNEGLRAKVAAQPRQWGPRPSTYMPAPPSPEVLRRREVMRFARNFAVANGRSITLAEAEQLMAQ